MNDQDQSKTEVGGAVASRNLFSAGKPFENEEGRLIKILTGSAALAKACQDSFDYAMKLRTGEVINFSFARVLNKEWVHLYIKPMDEQPRENRIAYPADRGVDVRLADIVWVMDAPLGS